MSHPFSLILLEADVILADVHVDVHVSCLQGNSNRVKNACSHMPCLAQTQVLACDFAARTEEHVMIETWQRLLKHHRKKGFRMANAL